MPDAVFCREEASGVDPHGSRGITVVDGSIFATNSYDIVRLSGRDSVDVVAVADAELFMTRQRPHELCWMTGGHVDCVPASGGAARRWLSPTADGDPFTFAAAPDGHSYVVGYIPKMSNMVTLARVDEAGNPEASFARIEHASSFVVFDDDVYVVASDAKTEIVRAHFDGSSPSTVMEVPSYCNLTVVDSKLYCTNADFVVELAPEPSEPKPLAGFTYPPAGDFLVRLEGQKVVAVNPDGSSGRVVWERPPGFEAESIVATSVEGTDVYVELAHRPCKLVESHKEDNRVCDDTRGRLEIVRASL